MHPTADAASDTTVRSRQTKNTGNATVGHSSSSCPRRYRRETTARCRRNMYGLRHTSTVLGASWRTPLNSAYDCNQRCHPRISAQDYCAQCRSGSCGRSVRLHRRRSLLRSLRSPSIIRSGASEATAIVISDMRSDSAHVLRGGRRKGPQSEIVLRAAWEGDAKHGHDVAAVPVDGCCLSGGIRHQSTEVNETGARRSTHGDYGDGESRRGCR